MHTVMSTVESGKTFFSHLEIGKTIGLSIDLANIVTFTIAIAALLANLYQMRIDRKSAIAAALNESKANRRLLVVDLRERRREQYQSAKALYRDYMKLAFDNPKLSIGRYDEKDEAAVDQYDTFVSMMLYAFDELMLHEKDSCEQALIYQLEIHGKYIWPLIDPEQENLYSLNYSKEMLDFMIKWFENNKAKLMQSR